MPITTDALFPFLIGLLEFAQIGMLGAGNLGPWFVLLSILFVAMAWISQTSMKRARAAKENDDFFRNIQPATWRDHVPTVLPSILLLAVGIGFWFKPDEGWVALAAVLIVIGLLAYRMWMSHIYTQRSYRLQ